MGDREWEEESERDEGEIGRLRERGNGREKVRGDEGEIWRYGREGMGRRKGKRI